MSNFSRNDIKKFFQDTLREAYESDDQRLNESIDHEGSSRRVVNEVAPAALALPAAAGGATAVIPATGTMAALFALGNAAIVGTISALLAGAVWWMSKSSSEQEEIAERIDRDMLHEAFAIYSALKGMGTNEDVVRSLISKKPSHEIQSDYAAVLSIVDDADSGGLLEWLRDDGLEEEARQLLVRMAMGK